MPQESTPRPWRLRESPAGTLLIENHAGQPVCTFYSATALDHANAEWIVQIANSWSNADALRTRIVSLTQLYSPTDSIDSPQEIV